MQTYSSTVASDIHKRNRLPMRPLPLASTVQSQQFAPSMLSTATVYDKENKDITFYGGVSTSGSIAAPIAAQHHIEKFSASRNNSTYGMPLQRKEEQRTSTTLSAAQSSVGKIEKIMFPLSEVLTLLHDYGVTAALTSIRATSSDSSCGADSESSAVPVVVTYSMLRDHLLGFEEATNILGDDQNSSCGDPSDVPEMTTYECPLCMLSFKRRIMITSCCRNNICEVCSVELAEKEKIARLEKFVEDEKQQQLQSTSRGIRRQQSVFVDADAGGATSNEMEIDPFMGGVVTARSHDRKASEKQAKQDALMILQKHRQEKVLGLILIAFQKYNNTLTKTKSEDQQHDLSMLNLSSSSLNKSLSMTVREETSVGAKVTRMLQKLRRNIFFSTTAEILVKLQSLYYTMVRVSDIFILPMQSNPKSNAAMLGAPSFHHDDDTEVPQTIHLNNPGVWEENYKRAEKSPHTADGLVTVPRSSLSCGVMKCPFCNQENSFSLVPYEEEANVRSLSMSIESTPDTSAILTSASESAATTPTVAPFCSLPPICAISAAGFSSRHGGVGDSPGFSSNLQRMRGGSRNRKRFCSRSRYKTNHSYDEVTGGIHVALPIMQQKLAATTNDESLSHHISRVVPALALPTQSFSNKSVGLGYTYTPRGRAALLPQNSTADSTETAQQEGSNSVTSPRSVITIQRQNPRRATSRNAPLCVGVDCTPTRPLASTAASITTPGSISAKKGTQASAFKPRCYRDSPNVVRALKKRDNSTIRQVNAPTGSSNPMPKRMFKACGRGHVGNGHSINQIVVPRTYTNMVSSTMQHQQPPGPFVPTLNLSGLGSGTSISPAPMTTLNYSDSTSLASNLSCDLERSRSSCGPTPPPVATFSPITPPATPTAAAPQNNSKTHTVMNDYRASLYLGSENKISQNNSAETGSRKHDYYNSSYFQQNQAQRNQLRPPVHNSASLTARPQMNISGCFNNSQNSSRGGSEEGAQGPSRPKGVPPLVLGSAGNVSNATGSNLAFSSNNSYASSVADPILGHTTFRALSSLDSSAKTSRAGSQEMQSNTQHRPVCQQHRFDGSTSSNGPASLGNSQYIFLSNSSGSNTPAMVPVVPLTARARVGRSGQSMQLSKDTRAERNYTSSTSFNRTSNNSSESTALLQPSATAIHVTAEQRPRRRSKGEKECIIM